MRALGDLLVPDDPGWAVVLDFLGAAKNHVEVLPCERLDGEATLMAMQVTSRSTLGAIALETGGMLIDYGWVRLLGAGATKMQGNLRSWNGLGPGPLLPNLPGAAIVALDVLGGVFALDDGRFASGSPSVHYFAPDSLDWEDTGKGYTDFLAFLFQGDLDHFYGPYRWPAWRQEISALDGDTGVSVYPFLWTTEGKAVAQQHRKAIAMRELIALHFEMRLQIVGEPA